MAAPDRRWLLPVAALVCVIAVAAPAAASGPWSAPQTLDDRGAQQLAGLDLATAPSGRATVVWVDSEPGRVPRRATTSAVRDGVGQDWSAPQALGRIGNVTTGPFVAMNRAGRAAALWSRAGAFEPLDAALLEAGASRWSPAATVVGRAGGAGRAAIAVGGAGDALAAWQDTSSGPPPQGRILVATRPAGAGSWSAPAPLSTDAARAPRLAIGRDEAFAIWSGHQGSGRPIEVAVRSATGAWSAPIALSRPGAAAKSANIALDAAGNAIAIWVERAVMAAERPAGGTFGAPVAVSAPGVFPPILGREQPPQIVVAADGAAAIAWRRAVAPGLFAVEVTTRPGPGPWRAPRRISPAAGRSVGQIALAGDARGRLAIGWVQPRGRVGVLSVRVGRATDGRFGPLEPLTIPAVEQPVVPRLAVDRTGRALAAWIATIGQRRAIRVAGRRPIALRAPPG